MGNLGKEELRNNNQIIFNKHRCEHDCVLGATVTGSL